jgi:integrase/recombinase XerD
VMSYTIDLRNFYKFLASEGIAEQKPEKINQTNIMAYMLYLEKTGKTSATICRKLASLKSFCRFLLIKRRIADDPAYKIKAPKTELKLPPALDPKALNLLMHQPDQKTSKGLRDIAVLSLLFSTGIKVSELIQLNVSDIRFTTHVIDCRSGKRKRAIILDKDTARTMKAYKETARGLMLKNPVEEAFFVNCNGARFTRQGLWKVIKSYAQKANIAENITPTALRHSFAMKLVSSGEDMESLQQKLGHVDTTTTQVYFKKRV